ncbi:chemotaxis protein [Candidatus Kapabacteria bacterium]|nr:chemotaxis protein [Candidatus Kapabacteria bacterium]
MANNTNILLESGTNEVEVVEFELKFIGISGNEVTQSFGINVAKVREIIRLPEITVIPNMPKSVRGVFELRKKIIPALDLSQYLYGKEKYSKEDKMIITEFNKIQTGLIVDSVSRIHRITWKDIVSPDIVQDFEPEKNTVVGIIQMGEKQILMLDVEKIVADIDPNNAIDSTKVVGKFSKTIKVITAEDSSIIRKMISSRLKDAGIEYESYNNGAEAWDRLREIEQKVKDGEQMSDYVDCIITDIEMPKMDGYTLTKRVKDNKILGKLPVVIFSSLVNQDIIHKGQSVGADAQLSKPQIGELLNAIRRILKV